jgi:hypothetical protein
MLIVYTGLDEVLVCLSVREAEMRAIWFAPGAGRDVDDYDREVSSTGIVAISSRMSVDLD